MVVLAMANVCAMALIDVFSQLHHSLFFTHRQLSGFHVGYTFNYKAKSKSETERRHSVLFIV